MVLNPEQQAHVDGAFPECRAELAGYLERGVDVVVYRQTECGDDVPAFAGSPHDRHEFGLGCWESEELAVESATRLGLNVVAMIKTPDCR
ncbi:hypothetical protein BKN49_05835 [Pseudomonas aeruginosa]|nr:hypothetical protein BKN49_05835 [Pseudomonas aeruginosa]